MNFAGFKKYIEEMDPSLEKKSEDEGSESTPVGNDYIDTLEDEFGIKWKDLSSLSTTPKRVLSSEMNRTDSPSSVETTLTDSTSPPRL